MPKKMPLGHADRQTVVEYALEVLDLGVFLVAEVRPEERGRRQLARIAHDHHAFGAGDRPYRLGGGNLRRFVEHHEVEFIERGI